MKTPAATNPIKLAETIATPATPIAAAPASETIASVHNARSDSPVRSERPALIKAGDARPEKAAHLVPVSRHQAPQRREADASVRIPQGAERRRAGDRELERGDPAAGLDDARELGERRARVVHVPEQI